MPRKKTEIVTDPTLEPAANDALPPKSERASGGWWLHFLLLQLLVLAVIVGIFYLQRDHFYDLLRKHLAAGDVSALQMETTRLAERITVLEAGVSSLSNVNQVHVPTGDADKLAQLETEIQALRQAAAPGGTSEELQQLRHQLQQLSAVQQSLSLTLQQQEAKTPPDLRLVALFQSLRARALEGGGYQDSYQRFIALAQPYPILLDVAEMLEPYASTGRPALRDIEAAFQDSLTTYLKEKEGVDDSLSGKIRRNLTNFIIIRKLDARGNSPLAGINRAEQFLREGKIDRAVTELEDLPEDIAPFFSAWIEEARAYFLIPQYVVRLDQRLADVVMQSATDTSHAP